MTAHTGTRERPEVPAKRGPKRGNPSDGVLGPQRSPEGAQKLRADQLLTAAQVAERWQVPKSQVYRLTRSGNVPVVQLGRYFRYRVQDIEEWERGGGANA